MIARRCPSWCHAAALLGGVTVVAMGTPIPPATAADTATNICGSNATIGRAVVASYNSSHPGLEGFAAAVASGDLNGACEALIEYYRTGTSGSWLRWTPPANFTWNSTVRVGGQTDQILDDVYFLSGVRCTAKIPRNADGGINWYFKGPHDDPEFMNCLNRHDQWQMLVNAWQETGNAVYATRFSNLVTDWVTHLPCRDGVSRAGWSAPGRFDKPCATGTMESPWRVLEAGIRTLGPWPRTFYGSLASPSVTTTTRVLMLLGLSEHVAVIAGPGRMAHTPNWQMTQWAGLIATCVAFPELMNATAYLDTAFSALDGLLTDQVYPDGMETEQAFGYDMGTARDFFDVIQLLNHTHYHAPQTYRDHVEKMFEYGTLISDQLGYAPRVGDTDLDHSGYNSAAQEYFGREDWLYVRTNGKNGTKPVGVSPSVVFPWGGQVALKSSYAEDGLWAWFDFGKAYGSSGHAHRAKLSLTLRRYGTMLLVDSGRFSYNGVGLSVTLNREYERMTHAHNTLTIDGKEQQAAPQLTTVPVPPTEWSFAVDSDFVRGEWESWDALEGNATHRRAVYFSRAGGWLAVVDQVISPHQSRTVQSTWHAHPNATVALSPTTHIATIRGVDIRDTTRQTSATCAIIPATGPAAATFASAKVVRGVQKGANTTWQGWYSQTYTGAWPASTVVYDGAVPASLATSRQESEGSYTFGWLITTASSPSLPQASIQLLRASNASVDATVMVDGETYSLHLPFEQPASTAQTSVLHNSLV
mmetsp:Transcript_1362/g.4443  ORF Transcript_1362/g.4443 Transcript_1362/m.4443 type:complete len:757 (-) Transcript_1362:115-2385(-)